MSYYEEDDNRSMFADPGGRSALRAASRSNPRNLPCPTCGRKNPQPLTQGQRAALGFAWFIAKVVLISTGIALFLWGTFAQIWR